MKRNVFAALALLALLGRLNAANPNLQVPTATPVNSGSHAHVVRPHNDLANALRALTAAKMFLAKAPNDSAGNRLKAQQAVDAAIAEVRTALGPKPGK